MFAHRTGGAAFPLSIMALPLLTPPLPSPPGLLLGLGFAGLRCARPPLVPCDPLRPLQPPASPPNFPRSFLPLFSPHQLLEVTMAGAGDFHGLPLGRVWPALVAPYHPRPPGCENPLPPSLRCRLMIVFACVTFVSSVGNIRLVSCSHTSPELVEYFNALLHVAQTQITSAHITSHLTHTTSLSPSLCRARMRMTDLIKWHKMTYLINQCESPIPLTMPALVTGANICVPNPCTCLIKCAQVALHSTEPNSNRNGLGTRTICLARPGAYPGASPNSGVLLLGIGSELLDPPEARNENKYKRGTLSSDMHTVNVHIIDQHSGHIIAAKPDAAGGPVDLGMPFVKGGIVSTPLQSKVSAIDCTDPELKKNFYSLHASDIPNNILSRNAVSFGHLSFLNIVSISGELSICQINACFDDDRY